jgi:ATP-dependent DNA helicase RecQ
MSVSLLLEEIGFALLQEVVAARNFNVKEKFYSIILVKFDSETGEGADMDDNVKIQK